jgi:hypothetical protein
MVARYWGRVTSDDAYNLIRRRYGDTTNVPAQLAALRALGLVALFRSDGSRADVVAELSKGRPVAVAWLHHGPVGSPRGGGHWSVVVGRSDTGWIMHDPYGEADLVRGGYVRHTGGAGQRYSFRNWEPRWLIEGPRSGWMITCRPA